MSSSMNNKYNGTNLIAKPKTFLERENNTLYYQKVGFSKRELHITKQNKMTEEKVLREIVKHGGGPPTIGRGYSYNIKPKLQIKKEESAEHSNPQETVSVEEQQLQNIKMTIENLKCEFQEVETWEDLDV
jgi:hypothetical protein